MSGQAAKPQLIYVLWGTDRFTRDEQVRGLKRRMLAEPCGEYNLSGWAGGGGSGGDVRAVGAARPFMGAGRVSVVEGLLAGIMGSGRPAARGGRGSRAGSPSAQKAGCKAE